METTAIGDLVSVAGTGDPRDGIVYDTPSPSKVIVAVVDPRRGPGFRTVHPNTLTEREKEGPHDPALRLLIRRTPPPSPVRRVPAAQVGKVGRASLAALLTVRPANRHRNRNNPALPSRPTGGGATRSDVRISPIAAYASVAYATRNARIDHVDDDCLPCPRNPPPEASRSPPTSAPAGHRSARVQAAPRPARSTCQSGAACWLPRIGCATRLGAFSSSSARRRRSPHGSPSGSSRSAGLRSHRPGSEHC